MSWATRIVGLTIVEALVKTDTPAILVVPDDELTHARTMTAGLPGVGVLRASASDDAFTHSVTSLGVASPMDDSDRRFYTAEAVAALRDLAMARPAGLDVNEAKAQLERTVESTSGPAQLQVAEVLALINDGTAQQSLIDAALATTDEWQQVSLLDLAAALCSSIWRPSLLATSCRPSQVYHCSARRHSRRGSSSVRCDEPRRGCTYRSSERFLSLYPALHHATLAQLAERSFRKAQVSGSSPLGGSFARRRACLRGVVFVRFRLSIDTDGGSLDETPWADPSEVETPHTEGRTRRVWTTRYERNRHARQKCLDHWGCRCVVCNMSFGDRYGDIGQGYIHVHHLNPISDSEAERSVDGIHDLRPVCPNCHAMLHRRNPPISITECQSIISDD